jgi:thiosulfate/3-mercaptopyruvate sulfurtransferase
MSSLKDEDGFIRDKRAVTDIFKKAGVNLSEPLICTCNSGVMASYLLAAAESTECKGTISVYDGAWSEYSKKAPNAMN